MTDGQTDITHCQSYFCVRHPSVHLLFISCKTAVKIYKAAKLSKLMPESTSL